MKYINQLNNFCLILAVFFLPIHLNFNNIFITCFICLSLVLLFFENRAYKWRLIKQSKQLITLVSIPFLLNAVGLIYTDELVKGFDYTIRAIPFFFLPVFAIATPKVFVNSYKKMGYALLMGCLIVAVYSWSHAIVDIANQQKPWKELIGPLYSHHSLVKKLDLHAAYLSICIYTAIGFVLSQLKTYNRQRKLIVILAIFILIVFMFHLLSRNAIIYFLLASIVYLVYQRKWSILVGGFATVILLAIGVYNVKHNYLRDRLFKSLNLLEKETQFSKKDDRFDRLAASYEIFLNKPIIGYGTAGESKHRRLAFQQNNDKIAYERDFNAHNQFFEYLSTFGLLGAASYLTFFGFLFFEIFKQKNGFFLYVFTGLFLACLTESIFERSQGVVYTAVSIALLISCKLYKNIDELVELNDSQV